MYSRKRSIFAPDKKTIFPVTQKRFRGMDVPGQQGSSFRPGFFLTKKGISICKYQHYQKNTARLMSVKN